MQVLTANAKRQVIESQDCDHELPEHEVDRISTAADHTCVGASVSFRKEANGQAYTDGGDVSFDATLTKGDSQAAVKKQNRSTQLLSFLLNFLLRAKLRPLQPLNLKQLKVWSWPLKKSKNSGMNLNAVLLKTSSHTTQNYLQNNYRKRGLLHKF